MLRASDWLESGTLHCPSAVQREFPQQGQRHWSSPTVGRRKVQWVCATNLLAVGCELGSQCCGKITYGFWMGPNATRYAFVNAFPCIANIYANLKSSITYSSSTKFDQTKGGVAGHRPTDMRPEVCGNPSANHRQANVRRWFVRDWHLRWRLRRTVDDN